MLAKNHDLDSIGRLNFHAFILMFYSFILFFQNPTNFTKIKVLILSKLILVLKNFNSCKVLILE